MVKSIKKCRICGKEYEGCKTAINNYDGVFRWQEVACCPEHGAEYLARVLAARGETAPKKEPEKVEEQKQDTPARASRKKNREKSK